MPCAGADAFLVTREDIARDLSLPFARIGGTIEKVYFTPGALVKAGDLLYLIDPRPYQAEVARDQAQLESARAQVEVARSQTDTARTQADLAKVELARADKLLAAHAISQQEYDQLTATAKTSEASVRSSAAGVLSAEAAVHSAEAALRSAQLNLDYTSIRAPISGRVSRTNVTAGNLIDDKTDLTSIVSTSQVFAYFDGSEATYLRLRGLKPAQLTVRMGLSDETGVPHTGRVDFIDNQLNPQTGAIRLRAVFDNSKGEFAPGLFARIQLTGAASREMVVTPDRAIGTDQNKKFVIVVGANNQSEFRDVQPGPLLSGGLRAIESGLKAGDLVIYSGLQRVHPGMPVTPNKHAADADGNPVETPPGPPAGAPAASKS